MRTFNFLEKLLLLYYENYVKYIILLYYEKISSVSSKHWMKKREKYTNITNEFWNAIYIII